MRLVAWNCARKLHCKIGALMALRPDVAVISEAAKPERLVAHMPELADASLVWTGKYPDRELLLAGFGTTALEAFDRNLDDDPLHHVVPVSVTGLPGLDMPIHLLGVYAQNSSGGNRRKNNPGPLRRSLRRYDGFLRSAPAVVAGDFNNHVCMDKPDWPLNHANAVRDLACLGLVSAYHVARGVEAGHELDSTYFHRYREAAGFHIDYVFMPEEWADRTFNVDIGQYQDWIKSRLSDHVPLVLDVRTTP